MLEPSKYSPKTLWDPFRSLSDIRDDFDRLFGRIIPERMRREGGFSPAVDIVEEKDKYIAKAELPGTDQKDVKITLNDNVLTIKGERKNEYEEKKEGIHRIERSYGSFCRSFRLENEVVPEKVKADYKDGILTVDLPKSGKEKVKEVEVKVS